MKACNKCNVSKELACFHRSKESKDGLYSICKACKNAAKAVWKRANKEINRRHSREHYQRNSEVYKRSAKRWRKCNSGLVNFMTNMRREHIKRATPPWVNRDELRQIYKNCPKGMHVDHIIPLRGKTICGLHVPENLQYLPALENVKKGNRYHE